MPRALRRLPDKGFYHIISRGNNRLAVFNTKGGCEKFIGILKMAKTKFDWRIYHYCLMPNHVHLLSYVENGMDLPLIMQYVLQEYSRWYRKKIGYLGYLWQGRYKSPLIESDGYLLQCGRYIERNPVRANLVTKPEDYPWSSYRHYVGTAKDPIINENPLYAEFGIIEDARQQAYRDFVSLKTPYETLLDKAILDSFF